MTVARQNKLHHGYSRNGASVIYLSDLLDKPILGKGGETIGRLKDLVVRMSAEDQFPPITGLVAAIVGRPRHRFFIHATDLARLTPTALHLKTSRVDLRPFVRRDGEVLLNKDVLDKQIVDVNGRRVIRVNDITLAEFDGTWRLAGADVSTAALLHRLGLDLLGGSRLKREVIPWDTVQFFASEVPVVKLKLSYDKLARLHPMDLARIVEELGYRQGSEVIAALDGPLAADTVEGMTTEMQSTLINGMDLDEAADLLEEMAPDEAADLLADLPQERAQDLLEAMEPMEAAEVKRLMEYPANSAGGLMTTEYVAVPQDLTVQETLERLRRLPWLPDMIYYVYILDDEASGHLVGVVTLRDLITASPSAKLTDIMNRYVITGWVTDSQEEVAQKIAHYNLLALPILDENDRLVGIVTVDDAMDVILPEDWKQRVPRIFH